MIYALKTPITLGERTVKELDIIDRPKVKNLLSMDTYTDGSVAQMVALIGSLTNESILLINELEPEDYAEIRYRANNIYKRFVYRQVPDEEKAEKKDDPTGATAAQG
jgi:hypothetical protein